MKINKFYLEQLIIEQMQLMENNQSSIGFLQALLQIGHQWEETLGRRALPEFRDMSPEERSEIFRNFAKEKLNAFSGKYIFIKSLHRRLINPSYSKHLFTKAKHGRGGSGPYSIPFNFAFGQIASFSLIDTENILINIDNVEATTPQSSSTQLTLSPRFKSLVPPTVNLKIDDLLFTQRRNIEIYDDMLEISISDGVEILISDSSNILSVAQDMGVHIPSSDNEAVEFIREAVYDEEEIDIFYKRIFRNPNFYSSAVGDYLENLESQLRNTKQ